MRKIIYLVMVFMLSACKIYAYQDGALAETTVKSDEPMGTSLAGDWKVQGAGRIEDMEISTSLSRTFLVHAGVLKDEERKGSYGAAMDLRYFLGLPYDFIRNNIPGKTISATIIVPRSLISSNALRPNYLQISVKSNTQGAWVEYFGDPRKIALKEHKEYQCAINIPREPVRVIDGMFEPKDTALLLVGCVLPEGSKRTEAVSFLISGLKIGDVEIDEELLKWQKLIGGYASSKEFLISFPPGSTLIRGLGNAATLRFSKTRWEGQDERLLRGKEEAFVSVSVFIPEELRRQKGTISFTANKTNEGTRSTVKNFHSCDIDGKIYFAVPISELAAKDGSAKEPEEILLELKIKTVSAHTREMMPIIIEPVKIVRGRLIPFDGKWRQRDITSPDKTKKINGYYPQGKESYQMDLSLSMQGGIDWSNPGYKVELIRDFDAGIVDMDNMHLEVLISPTTDTTLLWQRPYRARLGLVDERGNVMFGPNVSLSEGVPVLAALDVSLINPIPKGLIMQTFDPRRVKAVIINIEAPHVLTEKKDIELSFINLSVQPREYDRAAPAEEFDFSRFKRDPSLWQITELIKENGGFSVGMNYPFPVVQVPPDILAVPQVYPCVGQKPQDVVHLGLSSETTKKKMIADLVLMAEHDIRLLRVFTLGHLSGVFSWDERRKDIKGFRNADNKVFQKMAGMKAEELRQYLNDDPDDIFEFDGKTSLGGVEAKTLQDLFGLLDIMEEVEKKTGKRMLTIISLYDFTFADGAVAEGPEHIYDVGEYPQIVSSPMVKVKVEALVWKMMKILSRDPRFFKYVAAMEVINEPENATVLNNKADFQGLVNFVGENMYLVKDAVGPAVPVTVGFRSWPPDLRFWKNIREGIDLLAPHYWQSFESYNNDSEGMWPLDMPSDELWYLLGTEKEGRFAGMAELSPLGEGLKNDLFRLETAGYKFALIWSFSGHDGYDAKKRLKEISGYQKGLFLGRKLKELPKNEIKKAYIYIIKARGLFDAAQEASPGADFHAILKEKIEIIKDPQLKKTISDVLNMAELKGISLSQTNIGRIFKSIAGGTDR